MSKRICVIGAGRWGKNHLKVLKRMNALAAIVEINEAKKNVLNEDYPDVTIFSGVRDAVETGFDGYVVATPAPTHYEIAKFLIEKEQHILVEKPL
ncbi:Gfo/Idh/MocA family oxidoreductase, partial [Candidatus Omnitrophota bacterium]